MKPKRNFSFKRRQIMMIGVVLACALLSLSAAHSQTNSVELRDSSGALVGQYSSIGAAYGAIPNPMSQPYLIEPLSSYTGSSENFPIALTVRTGSSGSNTVTIRPAAGVTAISIAASVTTPIVNLDDADYVTIDGRPGGVGSAEALTLNNMSTSGTSANTIQFINGATNNTVRNCRLLNGTANSAGPRTVAFATSASNLTGNSDNLILDCFIDGGRTGVGSNGTAANPNLKNVVRGCVIKNWGYAGIWVQTATSQMLVDSCFIFQESGFSVTNPSGINFSNTAAFTFTVRKSRIYDVQSTSTSTSLTIRGIYSLSNPGAGSETTIENNFIALPHNNQNVATQYGIALGGANDYTLNIYYNSIRIGGTHTGGTASSVVSAAYFKNTSGAASVTNVINNLFINDRTGGTSGVIHTGGAISNTAGTLNINYNSHYASGGSNSFHAVWGSTGYNVLSEYQAAAAPSEQNSKFRSVSFVSSNDLHLTGTSIGDTALGATHIPAITVDIDGQSRNAIRPYMGADERPEAPIVVSADEESELPSAFALYQNYPNPFNPSTSLRFDVSDSRLVTIAVYDLLGRRVATLTSADLKPGTYTATWDGTTESGQPASTAVYFVRMTTTSATGETAVVSVRRIVLVK